MNATTADLSEYQAKAAAALRAVGSGLPAQHETCQERDEPNSTWLWRCHGYRHCPGELSLGHPTQAAAETAYATHATRNHGEHPTSAQLHARRAHPGFEYATTEGPRKQWYDAGVPPCDDHGEPDHTWQRNTDAGRNGWDRFDYTEECYWRRPRPRPAQPAAPPPARPCDFCSRTWEDGKPRDRGPAVARWTFPNGSTVILCQECVDGCFDNADDHPDLEPASWTWLPGRRPAPDERKGPT